LSNTDWLDNIEQFTFANNMRLKLAIYWIRRDFRLIDNPALTHAIEFCAKNNTALLPMFVLDKSILEHSRHPIIGKPRRQYLAKVLAQFADQFVDFEIALGTPKLVFSLLQQQFDLDIFLNDDIEPYSIARDTEIKEMIGDVHFHSFTDQLTAPSDVRAASSGNIYSVFTPFKNAVWSDFLQAKIYAKADIAHIKPLPSDITKIISSGLDPKNSLELLSKKLDVQQLADQIYTKIEAPWQFEVGNTIIDLDQIIGEKNNIDEWYSTENFAVAHFQAYLDSGHMDSYKQDRDDLGNDTQETTYRGQLLRGKTSRMSPALKWGLVSARFLKELIVQHHHIDVHNPPPTRGIEGYIHYLSELIWREFYRYILLHHPSVLYEEFQPKYRDTIDWVQNGQAQSRFLAWIKGETGYPAVDAAMHQIASISWMHNRSRMMVASILTKNLGVDWRWGQDYFRAVLLDLDEASNNGGWQWAASVGADPKPIRIFNPYLQAENYDAQSAYQKTWLPAEYDSTKPPLIEHKKAREEALTRYHLASHSAKRDF